MNLCPASLATLLASLTTFSSITSYSLTFLYLSKITVKSFIPFEKTHSPKSLSSVINIACFSLTKSIILLSEIPL